MKCKFTIGQQVKIDKNEIKKVLDKMKNDGYNTAYKDLKSIIDTNDGIYKTTNIYTKNIYTKDEKYRIKLNNDFVFNEDELIKIE